jgi:hypothetical protein
MRATLFILFVLYSEIWEAQKHEPKIPATFITAPTKASLTPRCSGFAAFLSIYTAVLLCKSAVQAQEMKNKKSCAAYIHTLLSHAAPTHPLRLKMFTPSPSILSRACHLSLRATSWVYQQRAQCRCRFPLHVLGKRGAAAEASKWAGNRAAHRRNQTRTPDAQRNQAARCKLIYPPPEAVLHFAQIARHNPLSGLMNWVTCPLWFATEMPSEDTVWHHRHTILQSKCDNVIHKK